MKQPAYHTTLPPQVRFDRKLPANAKLLYAEIKALCDQQGYCWASNYYLATLYGVQAKVVSRWIHQLREREYLRIEVSQGNQRKIFVRGDLLKRGSPPPVSVEGVVPKVEGSLPVSRADAPPLLIDKYIDYNDRIHSASTPDSSIKKKTAQVGKESELPAVEFVSSPPWTRPNPPVAPHPPSWTRLPPPKQSAPRRFIQPSVNEAEDYMLSQQELCPDALTARAQALRFVNYYESNGWKVGRNAMQDWRAAANNWLLNAKEYADKASSASRNDIMSPSFNPHAPRLHSGGKKDYSIPL